MTPNSIWFKLDRFPPVLVRLLARNPDGTAMTDRTIVERSGLSIAEVKRLSFMTGWAEASVGDLRNFVLACGLDFANRTHVRNAGRYLLNPKFTHLRRSKDFPVFREMLRVYYDSQTK